MHLPNIESIQQSYEHVYVSPHMDDAVMSCGGRIATQLSKGERVLVVTVFTGDVDEKKKPRGRALDPIINIKKRRVEDEKAMERLGVDYLWLDYIDGIFRYKVPLLRYGLHTRVMDKERTLCEALLNDIRKICMVADNKRLFLALGAGQHVDHQIVFQAGIQLKNIGEKEFKILFYEDFPYVFFPNVLKYRMKLEGLASNQRLMGDDLKQKKSIMKEIEGIYEALVGIPTLQLSNPLLKPIIFFSLIIFTIVVIPLLKPRSYAFNRREISSEISDVSAVINEKMDAILEYRSQFKGPFEDRKKIKNALSTYSQAIGGSEEQYLERYWRIVI